MCPGQKGGIGATLGAEGSSLTLSGCRPNPVLFQLRLRFARCPTKALSCSARLPLLLLEQGVRWLHILI